MDLQGRRSGVGALKGTRASESSLDGYSKGGLARGEEDREFGSSSFVRGSWVRVWDGETVITPQRAQEEGCNHKHIIHYD
jgi:hypothetical protein